MVDPFFYDKVLKFQCRQCRNLITLNDLNGILWDEKNYIESLLDESFTTHIDIETPASSLWWGDFGGSGGGAQIIEYTLRSTICNCEINHTFKLFIDFSAIIPDWNEGKRTCYLEEIEEILALNSETMILTSDFLLLKGEEILNVIHFLFLRWAALLYKIEIFCPYIYTDTCWKPLLKIISNLKSNHYEVFPISIYTRKLQEFRRLTLEQQINKWINDENLTGCFNVDYEFEDPPCYDDPFYPCIHNFGKFITSNVYSTNINFHAKYYAAYSDSGRCEIVLTSFNLISSELDQYETFKVENIHGLNLDTIRPKLGWKKFILKEELLRKEGVDYFSDERKVKKYINAKGCRVSSDLINGVKLNVIIRKMLDKAITRAKKNGRITVKSFDI